MERNNFKKALVVCDGSVRNGKSGYGFIILHDEKIIVGCGDLNTLEHRSTIAETFALSKAIEYLLENHSYIRKITALTDYLDLANGINGTRPISRIDEINNEVDYMRRETTGRGVLLELKWIKSHKISGYGAKRDRYVAHEIADKLAILGVKGVKGTQIFTADKNWQETILDFNVGMPGEFLPQTIPYDLAKKLLRIEVDTINQLIKHGYLEEKGYGVTKESFLKIKSYMNSKRKQQESCRGPKI